MININDIFKFIQPIKNKIMLLIGRSILKAITNSGGTQTYQISGFKNETITGIEKYSEYGFESYPKKDCEVLTVFLNGNRDQGVAITAHDRRYRPKDLSEGDVRIYDWLGNKIKLESTGITVTDKNNNEIEMTATGTTITDLTGKVIKLDVTGITLQTGDASTWKPNILPVDPVTGIPHGGALAGIILLKGL